MALSTTSTERSYFVRHPELAGLELRRVIDASNTERTYFSRYHQVFISCSWSGIVWHRQRERVTRQGDVVEALPGELMISREGRGELYCVTIAPRLRERVAHDCAANGVTAQQMIAREPAVLIRRLREAIDEQQSIGETEQRLRELLSIVSSSRVAPPTSARANTNWEKTREQLERMGLLDHIPVDLGALSKLWGRSRFSALRLFKRRFGLPPLSYQIHLRVEQAQAALRAGERPARVAADCGFFDQSHLTRHFKRILGTTPAQYARASARPSTRSKPDDFAGQALIPLRRIGEFFTQEVDHGSHLGRQLSH